MNLGNHPGLTPLGDHNSKKRKLFDPPDPTPNGIACPKCGTELLDSTPGMALLSHPPQHKIHCTSCNYHGYRF